MLNLVSVLVPLGALRLTFCSLLVPFFLLFEPSDSFLVILALDFLAFRASWRYLSYFYIFSMKTLCKFIFFTKCSLKFRFFFFWSPFIKILEDNTRHLILCTRLFAARCGYIVDAERHRRTPWTLAHWSKDIVSVVSACFRDLCIIYDIGSQFLLLQ